MIKQTEGSVTVTDRADELIQELYVFDSIDADFKRLNDGEKS